MGVEFLPICDVLFNVVSLASYFCDVVFDVITTYTFFLEGSKNALSPIWFWLCLFSILISLLVCQFLSAKWMLQQEATDSVSRRKLVTLSAIHLLQGGMIWRYSLLFAPIQLEHVKQEMRNLCVLRMIHGFVESLTMLLVQTYIACTSKGSVKEVNVISMALSLFNVCWALASFTKNIRQHNVHRLVLTWIGVIFQFMWRLGTLTSRVLVLVLYSTVYTYWVFLVVILHWVSMLLWIMSRYAVFHEEKLSHLEKVGLSIFMSYINIFCYVNLEEQSTKFKIFTFYSIMLVENILLVTLTLTRASQINGWDRNNIVIGVFSSFFLGILFMLLYYRYFHVSRLSSNIEPVEKPRKSKEPDNHNHTVTVFNCALNPALRKKKKMPSRSVPPPPADRVQLKVCPNAQYTVAPTPFWKEPLPLQERTEGDGLSYSRTTSVDDIRIKLQEKREKQLQELRKIEKDIASGRLKKPSAPMDVSRPIPVLKRQPVIVIPGDFGDEYSSDQDIVNRQMTYKESSGDQGDVDSGDEVDLTLHQFPSLPLPRSRIVIGGNNHETPL